MKRFLLCFLVIALFGCSNLYNYHSVSSIPHNQHKDIMPVYLDKEFSKQDRKIIDQVIKEWNYALNGYLTIHVVPYELSHNKESILFLAEQIAPSLEGVIIVKINHDDELMDYFPQYQAPGMLGFVDNLGEEGHFMAIIGDAIGTKNLHKILLHEFGHLMGAMHIATPSLMYPEYGYKQTNCIDKITMAYIAEYRKYDLKYLNYCSIENFE